MHSRENELRDFKTQINLCEYAASIGFILDRKTSSRHSVVMKHANGDKIVISRNSSKHWLYFNVHNEGNDSGTIIDFIQHRKGVSLGEVRKELRQWAGGNSSLHSSQVSKLPEIEPSKHEVSEVLGNWIAANAIDYLSNYLTGDRLIPSSVLQQPIFEDRIRTDRRSNMLFPHWDHRQALCGFEMKNRKFTGFAPGGTKGLWCSRPRGDDRVMVLAETAIDALSVASLFGVAAKRFFSTAGQISPAQKSCIRSAVSRMPAGSEIWLCYDNDDGGRKLLNQTRELLDTYSISRVRVVDKLPNERGDDWNDVLRRKSKPHSPRPI